MPDPWFLSLKQNLGTVLSHPRKTTGGLKQNNTEPPPCVIYPKEGKETLEVNLEKTWSRDQREIGSGVGYAKGRY
jgi:hypothetical protein